ncbi:Na/Pi cotransporter family protein [Microvirga mediterraneensis]|uniref:Na/Pi cotransporter family protein n=1 Tax=Microvirga mediterraneensis TaxID=2754695 RepID=A0A838BWI9_9HYPH|nr:Na/Pi cotransporter family protein [Microvirga mediterraneensis]MBA1158886.1 Na/Pi cotransporter family protein [Microvirga mediterraneensis]
MIKSSQHLFKEGDLACVSSVKNTEEVVDSLHGAIDRYLSAINPTALSEDETRRLSDILIFAINLEHIGDIINKNLAELAAKRIKNQLWLPEGALIEITQMHEKLLDHLHLAVSVLTIQDVGAARRLVAEKDQLRELERTLTLRHFEQLRAGQISGDVSTFQLDVVRDLKRIDGHISALARSLLERSGGLRPSRLA